MKKSKAVMSSAEFDRRFDAGEDIHDLIDMSQATVPKQGEKVSPPAEVLFKQTSIKLTIRPRQNRDEKSKR